MEDAQVRALIRAKLADARLPHVALIRVWGGAGDGRRACVACDEAIRKNQILIAGADRESLAFHVRCFHLWDSERRGEGPVFRLPTNNGGA